MRVEGVSKKFCKDLKRSLWYGIQDITSELFGLKKNEGLRRDEFWAVNEVSFELKRGECLGLIGHNGAGKSTLLKMLNGLIKPDKGSIMMKGRIGALIELGAGFNPILTGRENVFNNGAVLGFTQEEIAKKYKAIVEFAELEEFMDTPVQNYSSGMKVRLGFAVAAQMEPDVLIIDEVLAVGDLGFRIKCLNEIQRILSRSSVIFVSHSMPHVGHLCTHCLLLKSGEISCFSNTVSDVIDLYQSQFSSVNSSISGSGDVALKDFKIMGVNSGIEPSVNLGDFLNFQVILFSENFIDVLYARLIIRNIDQRAVSHIITKDYNSFQLPSVLGEVKLKIESYKVLLSSGRYYISVYLYDKMNKVLCRVDNVASIYVKHSISSGADSFQTAKWELK
ncbi:MAG: ABC transporter ATP-binding protein [Cyclobacteriaceae bacterium]